MRRSVLTIVVLLCAGLAYAEDTWTSKRGLFVLEVDSAIDPIVINTMHSWELVLTDAEGAAVEGATFDVSGGMPEHDHGLATAPRVTEELGNGRYRLDGLRFHMAGDWELVVEVRANDYADAFTIVLTL